MRRIVFLLLGLAAALQLSAQDSTTVAAYLPSGSVRIEKQYPDNPTVRFLTVFYQTIRYPESARTNGITGAVLVTFTIDTVGQLSVEDTQFLGLKDPNRPPPGVDSERVLTITAMSTSGSGRSPSPTTNRKRLLRGQADLEKEVARTLEEFPLFEPARRDGQKVPDTQRRLVFFNME